MHRNAYRNTVLNLKRFYSLVSQWYNCFKLATNNLKPFIYIYIAQAFTDALVGVKAFESKVADLEGLSTVKDGFASGNVISSSDFVPPTPVTNSNINQQKNQVFSMIVS